MGVWTEKLGRVFASSRRTGRPGTRAPRAVESAAALGDQIVDPVALDLADTRADPDVAPGLSKRELLAEMQKNYNEVLGLVRKVDQHLDEQSARSRQLMDIAERTARAVESLPEIQKSNAELAQSVRQFSEATREHETAIRASLDQQAGAIESHTAAIAEFRGSVTDSVSGMAASADRLGEAIAAMRETDRQRERELAELVTRSQKSMLTIVITCVVLAAGTLVVALVALL
jgi:methyl-accepting chemotaxis protein